MLYLMRHGMTDWNALRKLQGHTDIPLNETGRQMAAKAREMYQEVVFDCCYCSPLIRARETAEIFLQGRELSIETDERLKELSFGCYEGLTNLMDVPESPIYTLFHKPAEYVAQGGAESLEALFDRTGSFLREVVTPQLQQGKSVLIVGHGAMNSSIICQARHLSKEQFWDAGIEKCKLIPLPEFAV